MVIWTLCEVTPFFRGNGLGFSDWEIVGVLGMVVVQQLGSVPR